MQNAHGNAVPEETPVSLQAQSDPTRLSFYAGQGLSPSPVQATQKVSEVHPDAHAFFQRTADSNEPPASATSVVSIASQPAGSPTRPGLSGEASPGAVGAVDPVGSPQTPTGLELIATAPSVAADSLMMKATDVLGEQPVAAPVGSSVMEGVPGGPPAAGAKASANQALVEPPRSDGDPNTVVGAPEMPIEMGMTPPGASAFPRGTEEEKGSGAIGVSRAQDVYGNPVAPPAASFAVRQNTLHQPLANSMAEPANGVMSASAVGGGFA